MNRTTVVSIIRERGQLTIPDAIRKIATWATPSSAVTISLTKPNEIQVRPQAVQKNIEWDILWHTIRLSRSIQGKRGNLSDFIAQDRRRE